MERGVFHMRLVAEGYGSTKFNFPVAIDVIVRGNKGEDLEAVVNQLRCYLDLDSNLDGSWAGIGTGNYVKEVKLS